MFLIWYIKNNIYVQKKNNDLKVKPKKHKNKKRHDKNYKNGAQTRKIASKILQIKI